MAENIPGVHYPLATTGEVFAGVSNSKTVTPFGLASLYNRPSGIPLLDSSGTLPYIAEAPVQLWKADGTVFGYGYGSGSASNVGTAIHAAQNASISGDNIFVYSNAIVTGNLLKHGVDWWFAPVQIYCNVNSGLAPTHIFADNSNQCISSINGYADFIRDSTGQSGGSGLGAVLHTNHADSIISFNCNNISGNAGGPGGVNASITSTISALNGSVTLNANRIVSNDRTNVYWRNGDFRCKASIISCTGAYNLWADGTGTAASTLNGSMWVTADEIDYKDGPSVLMGGNTNQRVWINCQQIKSSGTAILAGGGFLYVIAEKIFGNIKDDSVGAVQTLYINAQKLEQVSTNPAISFQFGNTTSYLNIGECKDSSNVYSLVSCGNGTHFIDIQRLVRASSGNGIIVGNGNLILGGGHIIVATGIDLIRTGGTFSVLPGVSYTSSSGTLTYLGSSGTLQSIKTVDGSGSGLDTDLVRGVTGQFPATNLIALVPTGNQIPWFPTNTTAGLLPLSTFGQTLLSGDAATATGLLGLGGAVVIDSGAFQPSNSTLTGVANLSPTGNQFIAYKESGTPTLENLTNFGRNLIGATGLSNGTRTNRVLFSSGSGTPFSTDNISYDSNSGIFLLNNISGFRISSGNDVIQHYISLTGVEFNYSTGNVRLTVHGSGVRDLLAIVPSTNRVGIANSNPQATLDVSGGFRALSGIVSDITTNTINTSSGAVFQVLSTGRGSVPVPVMNSAQYAAISNKPTGLMAWVSDVSGIMHYNGVTTTRPVMMGSGGLNGTLGATQLNIPLILNDGLLSKDNNLSWDNGNSVLYVGDSSAASTYTRIYNGFGIYMYSNPSFINSILFTNVAFGATVSNTFNFSVGGTISNLLYTRGTGVGIGTSNPLSRLDVSGSFGAAITTLTTGNSPYTPTISNYTMLCNCTSGEVIVRLPASSGVTGRIYNIKKIDSTASPVTISGNANEPIDGVTTQSVTSQWTTLSIQAFGTGWYII